MTAFDETYTETITLTDTQARVWLATPTFSETLTLTDAFTTAWVVAETFTETLTLTDGDETVKEALTQASTSGGYITISAENESLILALKTFVDEMEVQSCPTTQTQISLTWDSDNNKYAMSAIVKRH